MLPGSHGLASARALNMRLGITGKRGGHMKKIMIAATALAVLGGSSAFAADLPVRYSPPPAAPVVVSYYSWTGCYIGGNVGGMWVKKDWTDADPLSATFGQSFGSHDPSGWLGGAQAGCNYQVGGWVFGIQGDYDWASAEASNGNVLFPGFTDTSKVKSLASVTGRIGYAWDRFLGYVKGGGAWERDDYIVTGPFFIATGSETRSGWTVGIGGEYAFTNNLSGFIEYDWYGFGTKTVAFVDNFGGTFPVDIKESKSVLKVGLNYKFGKAPAPVYTK